MSSRRRKAHDTIYSAAGHRHDSDLVRDFDDYVFPDACHPRWAFYPGEASGAAIVEALNEKYHLDDPLFKQYTDYMGDLLHGNLGPSFKFRDARLTN
jgi:hypothetical protein